MARGDQVYVHRELINFEGLYEHHGIDCGDGKVIRYRKPSETIEVTSIDTFSRGNRVYVRQYPVGFCFIDHIVVERAKSRLGESKYNILFNNCEHFAFWCKTGISESKQIRNFLPAIAKLNTHNLYETLKNAFQGTDPNNAQMLLNEALAEIKVIWDDIQPKYKQAVEEMNIWQQVAEQAVKQNRDDLARAAIKRKLSYRQRAIEMKQKLDKLATMTETLIRNSENF